MDAKFRCAGGENRPELFLCSLFGTLETLAAWDRNESWLRPRWGFFRTKPRAQSEVEHQAGGKADIVLGVAEEAGLEKVSFEAESETVGNAVINASAKRIGE